MSYSAAVGIVLGWLAGRLLRGNGYGLMGNIAAGIVGAVAGGFLLRMAGVNVGGWLVGLLIAATMGAAIVLFFVHFFTGRREGRRVWS